MAAYETSKSATTGTVIGAGWARQVIEDVAIIAVTTAMIDNTNDSVGLLYLPAGAVLLGATLSSTDMDTDGTPLLTWNVGDSGSNARIFSASTVSQAGTLSAAIAQGAHLYKFTTKTQLRAYVNAAAATGAAGTLYFGVRYFVDPDFSTTALVAA